MLKQAILDYVKRLDHVTFNELSRDVAGVKGELDMAIDKYNIIIWQNLSAEAVNVILELQEEGALHLKPTIPLTYMVEGVYLTLPVATKKALYKKPRWLPVVLKLGRGK